MKKELVYATYAVTDAGTKLLKDNDLQNVLLPVVDENQLLVADVDPSNHQVSHKRTGKGAHALNIARKLISDRSKWFDIKSSDDYNFPGIFTTPFPQRLGYCKDISQLPNFKANDPNFLYSDIQFGKGRVRPKCLKQMNINGKTEEVYYRFVPCGGVKRCAMYTEGCSYVVHTKEVKHCNQHPKSQLVRSGECPVVFFYIRPKDEQDNRRWLTGLVTTGNLQASDLHDHPQPKIPVKIDTANLYTEAEEKNDEFMIGS